MMQPMLRLQVNQLQDLGRAILLRPRFWSGPRFGLGFHQVCSPTQKSSNSR